MEEYNEILEKLVEIVGMELSIELLRSALGIINYAGHVSGWENKISSEQYKIVERQIDEIMTLKFKNLNPNFSEEIINKIRCSYHRGIILVPKDITVVDSAVFLKADELDDWGDVYGTRLDIVYDRTKNGFKEVPKQIMFGQSPWEKDEYLFAKKPYEQDRTRQIKTNEHIANSINSLLQPKLAGENIFKVVHYPSHDLNGNEIKPGYNEIHYNIYKKIAVYLDHNFNQICEAMYDGNPTLIKMIVTEGKDNFYYYEIIQTMENGIPVWVGEEKDIPIWKLSDALNSNKKIGEDGRPVLSRTQIRRLNKANHQANYKHSN